MEGADSDRRVGGGRKRKLNTRQGLVVGVAALAGLGLLSKIISALRGTKAEKSKDGDAKTVEAVLGEDVARNGVVKGDDEPAHLDNHESGIEMKAVDPKVLEAVLSSPPVPNAVTPSNPEKITGEEAKSQEDSQSPPNEDAQSVAVLEETPTEHSETVPPKTVDVVENPVGGSDHLDNETEIITNTKEMPHSNGEDNVKPNDGDAEKLVADIEEDLAKVEDLEIQPTENEEEHSKAEDKENHVPVHGETHSNTVDVESRHTDDEGKNSKVGDEEKHSKVDEEEKHSKVDEEQKHSKVEEEEKPFKVDEEKTFAKTVDEDKDSEISSEEKQSKVDVEQKDSKIEDEEKQSNAEDGVKHSEVEDEGMQVNAGIEEKNPNSEDTKKHIIENGEVHNTENGSKQDIENGENVSL